MAQATAAQARPHDRQAFYEKLAPHSLAPLWEVLGGLVPQVPTVKPAPHVWSYDVVRPLLLEAGGLLTAEEAERRVLVFENPALPGQSRITATLYAGIQLILPGETAPAHRHTASALRFVLESEGGATVVAGEKTTMHRGDFVITPNWAFHDHGNDGTKPVIWIDGLDLPIINFFEAGFGDHSADKRQAVTKPEGYSIARFGSGLVPLAAASPFGAATPIFNYPYARSRKALMAIAEAGPPDPHDGYSLRYANPIDGGWAMPTMATWLAHLPRGFETRPSRSTDGQTVVVVEGEIQAEIGGRSFRLGENDVLAIPGWTWRRFRACADAVLFAFSDLSAQEKLAVWREERN